MKQAGTTVISLAPETGSVRLQKAIKKNMNLPKLQEMISCACKLGIHVHGFFMLGFPTETKEDLIETEKFIADTQLHTADFFIVNVFPNTEMYSEIKALGKEVPEEFNNIDYHDATFNVSEHTNEELLKYQRKLFLMFYLNFSRILRILTSPVIKKKYLFYYFMIFMRRVVFRKRES